MVRRPFSFSDAAKPEGRGLAFPGKPMTTPNVLDRMAVARAARKPKTVDMPELSDDVVARARAQREAEENALRDRATQEARAAAQRAAQNRNETPRPDANGPTSLQRGAAKADADVIAREAAARAAVAPQREPGIVRVRVTKQGDGKVSTGQHAPGIGEVHYAWKEEFDLPAPIAQALEDRYFVEIL